ncbi:MAG: VWA domain-containing protein [Pyrinomonadaceae bacterium]
MMWKRRSVAAIVVTLLLCFCNHTRGQEANETVRIESDLVDLKVSVLGLSPTATPTLLQPRDFQVLEDGKPQEIAFFAASDAPFDLVLLLDLSGSTADKLKIIRRSAKRFIDEARPVDRIAIATFTDQVELLSNFTLNRKQLKQSIDDIDDAMGGTNFYDALNWVLTELVPQNHGLRRSAVVIMSDGVDNALPDVRGPGSKTTFEQLLQIINGSDAVIFSVYLDTEKQDKNHKNASAEAYAQAREQLGEIAAVCGTTLYRTSKLKDLDELYGNVLRDLSTVYSIGYRPTNRSVDGKWRNVQVRLVDHPDLQAKTKRGYFARSEPGS